MDVRSESFIGKPTFSDPPRGRGIFYIFSRFHMDIWNSFLFSGERYFGFFGTLGSGRTYRQVGVHRASLFWLSY